jgi:hypothetical protein
MSKTASFRPAIWSGSLGKYGITAVFKTAALNHSAISPLEIAPDFFGAGGRYTNDKHSAQAALRPRNSRVNDLRKLPAEEAPEASEGPAEGERDD